MWWGLRWLEGRLSWDTCDHSAHLPSPQKLSESRGEELEQLEPSPAPHSSLFSDIIEAWNGSVRRTRVPAQACLSPGVRRTKKLLWAAALLSSPLRGLGWRPCGTILALSHQGFSSCSPNASFPLLTWACFFTASFADNEQSVPLPPYKIPLYSNQLTP